MPIVLLRRASQEERFEVCVSGAAVLNHVCTSTYDCPNMTTFRVYLADRDGIYDTSSMLMDMRDR